MLRPTQLKTFVFSLREQHLDKWIVPYLMLYATFSGLEEVQEDPHTYPYALIVRIFESATKLSAAQMDAYLMEQFVHFPLFQWRARRQHSRTVWNPLAQTLEEFKAGGPTIVYEETSSYPDAGEVEKWLQHLLKP